MGKLIRQALSMVVAMSVVTGVAYPLLVTGVAQLLFDNAANGSIIEQAGTPRGSELIGQPFGDPKYFWSRPSATAPSANNASASSGSNQGPTNPALTEAARQRIGALRAADPDNHAPVPVDLVTASGSGLDPDISVAAAQYQISRVAKARGMAGDKVQALVDTGTRARTFGILGEPRVNVLELNLALDRAGR